MRVCISCLCVCVTPLKMYPTPTFQVAKGTNKNPTIKESFLSLNKLSADICLKRCTSLYIAEQNSLLPQCYCFFPGSIFLDKRVGGRAYHTLCTAELVKTTTGYLVILRASAYGSFANFTLLRLRFLFSFESLHWYIFAGLAFLRVPSVYLGVFLFQFGQVTLVHHNHKLKELNIFF